MPTCFARPPRTRLLTLACLLASGCSAELPPAAEFQGELRVAGQLALTGGLAQVREGGLCLRLSEKGSGRVLLQRIYDLGDPLWDRRDEHQALYFALGAEHAFDATPPILAPLEFAAVYLEPGVTRPAGDIEPRVTLAYAGPVTDARLTLHASSELAGVAEPLRPPSPR